jgi:stage V sporulation protein SpoVS
MEAKIMKMAKKLLAVVLTGVMAVSMLTGCASVSSRRVADELQGMLKAVNDKATVKAVDANLANEAVKAAKNTDGTLKVENTLKADVKTALSKNNNDKYVWYTYVETKDLNKTTKAQKIAKELITIENQSAKINIAGAVNSADVKVNGKSDNIKAGNKFELSVKEFSVGSGSAKKDYVMFVVTCKAVANAAA